MPLYRGSRRLILRRNVPPVGGGGPAFTFQNSANTGISGSALTASIDIGAAQADRLIVVGASTGAISLVTSVVVNGVTLNADVNSNTQIAVFSGIVASGSGSQTVTVTWASGNFNDRSFGLWRVTGLSSNLVKQTATSTGTTGTISVTAGDLMFGVAIGTSGTPTWASSTEAPFATHLLNAGGQGSAEWTIVGTNAAFALNSVVVGGAGIAVATYR